jgi:flagellar biosynthesis protein FlhA
MDGASKFIRGDAIAGILILFINMLGGLAVGVLQHGMPFGEPPPPTPCCPSVTAWWRSCRRCWSPARWRCWSRASRSQDMAQAMTGQVFGQYRALAITAGIIGVVGLVPGMPNVAFLTLAAILGFIAWKLYRKGRRRRPMPRPRAAAALNALGRPARRRRPPN